jgi:N utilization substance protein B
MKPRRQAREIALQALYLIDVSGIPEEVALLTQEEALNSLNEKDADFARDLVMGARRFLVAIDEKITEAAIHWKIERMTAIDRNILRLSAYELLYVPDTPPSVAIDEAIEIAREFSTDESSRFVNGILDKIKDSAKIS